MLMFLCSIFLVTFNVYSKYFLCDMSVVWLLLLWIYVHNYLQMMWYCDWVLFSYIWTKYNIHISYMFATNNLEMIKYEFFTLIQEFMNTLTGYMTRIFLHCSDISLASCISRPGIHKI